MLCLKFLQVEENIFSFSPIMMICTVFFFTTLETYYLGGLHMGPLNGVSDGVVSLYIFYALMTIFGNEMFKFILIPEYGIRLNDVIILGISVS
jgi:hypothetical protein